jgi:uncharacterized protein (TIGR00730 family)
MRRVCVYCGSSFGLDPRFQAAAEALGAACVKRGLGVVYGGGSVGLMGAVADAALEAGGEVIGVIPRKLIDLEKEHHGLTQLIEVETMHERKRHMIELADAFVALPGGYGTLEELFEALAWLQLGYHSKPVGLINVAGYYDGMLDFIHHMEKSALLRGENRALLLVSETVDDMLDKLAAWTAPTDLTKWLQPNPGLHPPLSSL